MPRMNSTNSQIRDLMTRYAFQEPKYWSNWSSQKRLDWIGERLLFQSREGVTSYNDIKEQGWMTSGQLYQRKLREVLTSYSEEGEDSYIPTRGVFSRKVTEEDNNTSEYIPVGSKMSVREEKSGSK